MARGLCVVDDNFLLFAPQPFNPPWWFLETSSVYSKFDLSTGCSTTSIWWGEWCSCQCSIPLLRAKYRPLYYTIVSRRTCVLESPRTPFCHSISSFYFVLQWNLWSPLSPPIPWEAAGHCCGHSPGTRGHKWMYCNNSSAKTNWMKMLVFSNFQCSFLMFIFQSTPQKANFQYLWFQASNSVRRLQRFELVAERLHFVFSSQFD